MSDLSNYHEFVIPVNEAQKEICIAWLDYFGSEVILEAPNELKAYFNEADVAIPNLEELAAQLKIPAEQIKYQQVENENWNTKWESNFQAVEVEDICLIRAEFHEPQSGFEHEILITPKMAFGTGHHETTYMMILQMSKMELTNKEILDYGCGTGILSVFAKQLGASHVSAIDIEAQAFSNTIEHIDLNGMERENFFVAQGDLDVLPLKKRYQVILANINRSVLLSTPIKLNELIENDGFLLISGILKQDENLVIDAYQEAGFKLLESMQKGDWLCIKFQKSINS